ncbi:MAG: extracellular solute-binding protein [Acetatifactor sp.]|nr:extracellular solute-binding protein [Acetatifactor sp.]
MKKTSKWFALMLATTMCVSLLTGCGGATDTSTTAEGGTKTEVAENAQDNNDSQTQDTGVNEAAATDTGYVVPDEPVTIKFLHKGPEPEGWAAVYEKYLEMTKDTLNIELDVTWVEHADYKEKLNLEITSGSDWDMVFDASWVQLKNLAPEGYYADLSKYFNNPTEYPGLAKAFSEDTMEANKWFGQMCYIPLYETYGNGIPVIWYRADWAKDWGIGNNGKINSFEEMEAYWQAALDAGYVAYSATQARGFFQLKSIRGEAYPGSAEAGLQMYSAGGLTIWTYTKDNKLVAYAVEGSGDEAFKDFPEGWNYDFGARRYDTFAEWQKAGYIDPDSLSTTDAGISFSSGLSASYVGTLDDYLGVKNYETDLGEGAVGYFVYVDEIRNKEKGAIPTNFAGNNGLAIPATSDKIEYTMRFLDWLFGSQEAHDLFQLGLEGVDFKYGDENGTYETLTTYSSDFGGYGWTWNPNYALISTAYDGEALAYRQYELDASSFIGLPILGFNFDTTDVDLNTAIAQCKAVTDKVATIKLHGITTDADGHSYDTMSEMLKVNVDEAMQNGGQEIVDAFVKQLTDFLATK